MEYRGNIMAISWVWVPRVLATFLARNSFNKPGMPVRRLSEQPMAVHWPTHSLSKGVRNCCDVCGVTHTAETMQVPRLP
jgi:hypothetical protein